MSFTVPPRSLFLRWNAIVCAVAILIWSTPEEDRPIFSAVLGAWLAASLAVGWLTGRYAGVVLRESRAMAAFVGLGAYLGAASNLCAVLLMIFKDARHGHMYPDYPPAMLGAMLARLPSWAFAGALVGLGAALYLAARSRRS
jgi:hypothetical protein